MSAKPSQSARRLRPAVFVAGLVALLTVMVGPGLIGLKLGRGTQGPNAAPVGVVAFLFVAVGLLLVVLGGAAYGLILLTRCFTLSLDKPFLPAYKPKLWFANLLVGLLVQGGFAFIIAPGMFNILSLVLPPSVAMPVAYFAPFMTGQLLFIWFTPWAPLEKMLIAKRLNRLGIPAAALTSGIYVGISNPERSSFKKLSLIEDDMGMMWIEGDRLVYRGDSTAWDIRYDQLMGVERVVDAGSTSAYFGAVHVILRFCDLSGVIQRLRIHSEGDWTMTGRARRLKYIADRLEAWHQSPMPGWPSIGSTGFPIAPHAGEMRQSR